MKELLIGKFVEITSNNKKFAGKIIKETQNTVTLRTDEHEKMFIKDKINIKINNIIIKGQCIKKRPEDKIKK